MRQNYKKYETTIVSLTLKKSGCIVLKNTAAHKFALLLLGHLQAVLVRPAVFPHLADFFRDVFKVHMVVPSKVHCLTFTTLAFSQSSLRWFGTSTCIAIPRGPPSSSLFLAKTIYLFNILLDLEKRHFR